MESDQQRLREKGAQGCIILSLRVQLSLPPPRRAPIVRHLNEDVLLPFGIWALIDGFLKEGDCCGFARARAAARFLVGFGAMVDVGLELIERGKIRWDAKSVEIRAGEILAGRLPDSFGTPHPRLSRGEFDGRTQYNLSLIHI